MIIWGAVFIPILVLLVLFAFYKHQTVWWEFLLQLGLPLVVIGLAKWGAETFQTDDTEYWGGWVAKAEYDEEWNEKVACTHEIPCKHEIECSHKDSKGRKLHSNDGYRHDNDGHKHAYDVDDHPPSWEMVDSNHNRSSIDTHTFEGLCQKFGNRTFVELHRDYHTKDGDRYVTEWDREDGRLEPVTTIHTYENKVQASSSVFNFPDVSPQDYGLFEYPKISGYYDCPSLLGDGGPSVEKARVLLDRWNAKLGSKKQVRLWVLVFKNKPLQAGFDQQSYWKGGNKNEFVVAIGVDDAYAVQWCHPFSWSEVEDLKVDVRNHMVGQKQLDLVALATWLAPEIESRFIRKPFAEFSYLSVEPPFWGVVVAYAVTLLFSLGLAVWVVQNEHREGRSFRPVHSRQW